MTLTATEVRMRQHEAASRLDKAFDNIRQAMETPTEFYFLAIVSASAPKDASLIAFAVWRQHLEEQYG